MVDGGELKGKKCEKMLAAAAAALAGFSKLPCRAMLVGSNKGRCGARCDGNILRKGEESPRSAVVDDTPGKAALNAGNVAPRADDVGTVRPNDNNK